MGQVCSVLAACFNFVCCCDDNAGVPVFQSVEEPSTSHGVWMVQQPQAAPGRRWEADVKWMEEEDMVFNEGHTPRGPSPFQGFSRSPSASSGRHVTLPLFTSTGNEGLASGKENCIVKYRIPLIPSDVDTYATHGLAVHEPQPGKSKSSGECSTSIPWKMVHAEKAEEVVTPMRDDKKDDVDEEQL